MTAQDNHYYAGIGDLTSTLQSTQDWTGTDWLIAILALGWLYREMVHRERGRGGRSSGGGEREKKRHYDED